MPKVPNAGDDHRDADSVCRGNGFCVAHRSTRMDDCRDSGFCRDLDRIRKWEERVRRHDRALCFFASEFRGDVHAVHAVGLPAADADVCCPLGKDNRIRLDVLARFPRGLQRRHFRIGRLTFRDNFPFCRRGIAKVGLVVNRKNGSRHLKFFFYGTCFVVPILANTTTSAS